ncbi:hypothetical protein D3875_12775 [Deinococcus cavernae]|uniref:SARP family transcriptional regulator n=1 Tax=Deinococcus cavernae TaxID=2320857 RepID=A0A418V855_9DEIO|nr:hypothetical protein [Deinococcus cavernae]RJF72293.1 hypothetical protein D3875_12775 [Deinococcus cavernae]
MNAPDLHLYLFGSPALRRASDQQLVPCTTNALRLLAVLALDGPQSRLNVADLLWDAPTSRALHNLRMTLYQLRRTLAEHVSVLQENGGLLALDLQYVQVDARHGTQASAFGRPEFMAGHRTRGSERWLEWANEHEEKLQKYMPELVPTPQIDLALTQAIPTGVPRSQLTPALSISVPPTQQGQATTRRPTSTSSTGSGRGRPGSLSLLYALDAAAEMDSGQYHVAAQAAQYALNLCPTGEGAALAHDTLAYIALDNDEFQAAIQHVKQGFQAHTDPPWELFYTAASLADMQGQYARAEQLTMQGLKVLRLHSSPALLQAVTASTYDTRGDFVTARRWHEWALESARHWPRPQQHCGVVTFYLWHLNATQDITRTHALGLEALDLGQFTMTPYVHNSLGTAALLRHEPELALQHLSPQTHHTGTVQIIALTKSALAYHALGASEQAHACLSASEPLAAHNEDGRAHYEWAVAALTIGHQEYLSRATRMVQGQVTNDSVLVKRYHRLVQDLQQPRHLN